jgi:hypothetical protein
MSTRPLIRERLAACLVLIACRNDDPTKFDAEWLTDEFVHRLCNTDCLLLDASSVMDFGEEAER